MSADLIPNGSSSRFETGGALVNHRLEVDTSDMTDVTIDCWVTAEINDLGLICRTESLLSFALQKGSKEYAECIAAFAGLQSGYSKHLEFAWEDQQGWVLVSSVEERAPEPDSKFGHRIEKANIDERTGRLSLSILFVDGMFWSTQNERFSHLFVTPSLIGLSKVWNDARQSEPKLKSYSVTLRENPPATGSWKTRPRYDFERRIDWRVHVVSDFRPDDDQSKFR